MAVSHPPDYDVDDIYTDPTPPIDAWGQFLSMRYCQRRSFYDRHEPSEQELIRKEMQRIEYFRSKFKDRHASPSDTTPIVEVLEHSRTQWRKEAIQRCEKDLFDLQGKADEPRNGKILRRVKQWRANTSPDHADTQNAMPSEDGVANRFTNNPDGPDYGYNGWCIVFENRKVGVDDPLCYGQFPHQKISIQELLYSESESPLKRSDDKTKLRYFHLPANNMTWVQVWALCNIVFRGLTYVAMA